MLRDLLEKTRSYRRFDQQTQISRDDLTELVDYTRLSPSGSNVQPLKYMLINSPEMNAKIFPCFNWAGYLKDWPGPEEGERPSAYIIILGDTNIKQGFGCDHGIASQSILLGAMEKGYGGCLIGSINRDKLREILEIPQQYEILLAVALGKPTEKVVLDEAVDGNIKYWRDEKDVHHVPKRPLDEIILK